MARITRPVWAIRCLVSGCKTLFEVAMLEEGKQQEVICPSCGEHYVYPPKQEDEQQ
ncbi:MAG: hypothetical protein PHV68_08410 [Candidatus Gastranaerophilales bacterium]|nr:hypothetical protein [Candidatus Gastranaerophilales bacterium]